MPEGSNKESSRNLLEDLEKGWDDASDDAAAEVADPAPTSAPTLEELDARWGDNLFGEDEDEEEDEEEEEPEPELPDEAIDPVAYAAAKKAREDRVEARRIKKKQKVESKRARRKARLEAIAAQQKKKQKAKKRPERAKTKRERPRDAVARAKGADHDDESDGDAEVEDVHASDDEAAPARPVPPKKKLQADKTDGPPWKLIAVGVALFLAAAAAFAALWR